MSLVQRRNGALVKLISVHHFHKCVHVREKSSSWRPKNVVWKCICCICAVQVRVLYSLPRLHAPYLLPTKVSFERLQLPAWAVSKKLARPSSNPLYSFGQNRQENPYLAVLDHLTLTLSNDTKTPQHKQIWNPTVKQQTRCLISCTFNTQKLTSFRVNSITYCNISSFITISQVKTQNIPHHIQSATLHLNQIGQQDV